ncbi:MAG TPA: ROK family protein [Thermoanaerobaculia bacterium]|nr:ROK family protein [Thermoanaerobaculia bacterium]
MKDLYLGIDLGGSKILAGVVTPSGKVLSRVKTATPFASGSAALARALTDTAAAALKAARAEKGRLIAIGLGSPGPLDPRSGVVLRTPNIAVRRFPAGRILSEAFGAPVVLDNDVHMAVYGELVAGAARRVRNVVGFWIGTGVGGCVIADGQVVHGVNQNAGELGHMILDARKAGKRVGRGTLEWEASKTGMARMIRKQVRKGKKTRLAKHVSGSGKRLHSNDLARAFRDRDKVAVQAVEHSARSVGIAVANLFDALAPELFLLGGGVAESIGRPYLDLVLRSAREHAFTRELGDVRVVASALKDDAGMLGAAFAARARHPASQRQPAMRRRPAPRRPAASPRKRRPAVHNINIVSQRAEPAAGARAAGGAETPGIPNA